MNGQRVQTWVKVQIAPKALRITVNGGERVNETQHGRENQMVRSQMILNEYVNKAELDFHQTSE